MTADAGSASVVNRALERLQELDGRAVPEHVAIFDDIHRALSDALFEAAAEDSGDRRS